MSEQEIEVEHVEFLKFAKTALQQALINVRDTTVHLGRMQSMPSERQRQKAAFEAHAALMRQHKTLLAFVEILNVDVIDPGLPGSPTKKTN